MNELLSESPDEKQRQIDEEAAAKFRRSRGLLPVPEVKKLDTSKYLEKDGSPSDSMMPPPVMSENRGENQTPPPEAA